MVGLALIPALPLCAAENSPSGRYAELPGVKLWFTDTGGTVTFNSDNPQVVTLSNASPRFNNLAVINGGGSFAKNSVRFAGNDVTLVPWPEFDWTSTMPLPVVAVPVSATAVEAAGAPTLTFSVAVMAPVVVGPKVTLMVHVVVPVGGKLAGQILPLVADLRRIGAGLPETWRQPGFDHDCLAEHSIQHCNVPGQ